jgi:hypothetical protein
MERVHEQETSAVNILVRALRDLDDDPISERARDLLDCVNLQRI